jgi:hypothetical protein
MGRLSALHNTLRMHPVNIYNSFKGNMVFETKQDKSKTYVYENYIDIIIQYFVKSNQFFT